MNKKWTQPKDHEMYFKTCKLLEEGEETRDTQTKQQYIEMGKGSYENTDLL